MAKKPTSTSATARLKQDYIRLIKDPVPYVAAAPLPSNILEWHYVVTGPEETPYEGGLYHGKLVFPREFPFKPPSIYMITPSGRFKTNTRLCLSISDFHPDTWNPAWTVSSILTGLISFMVETTPTLGSIETTTQTKRDLAHQSLEFNLRNDTFRTLFPETAEYIREQLRPAEVSSLLGEEEGSQENSTGKTSKENNNNNNATDDDKIGGRGDGDAARKGEPAGGGFAGGHVVNLCVFLGVAAFAITVKCVLASTR